MVDRQGKVRGRFRLTEPDQVEMLKKLLAVVEAEARRSWHRRTRTTQPIRGRTPAAPSN